MGFPIAIALKTLVRATLPAALLAALAGCDYFRGVPLREPDVLTIGIEAAPKTLDPRHAVDVQGMRITQQLLFETLVEQGADLEFHPKLATTWESPSPTLLRFRLRPGLRFHDGEPLTAESVKASFDSVFAKETGSPFRFIGDKVAAVRAPAPDVVEFEWREPQPSGMLDLLIPIFKQEPGSAPPAFVGSGPYRLERHRPKEMVLERAENYHGPAPFMRRLVLKVVKDDNTRYLKLRKGDLDLVINEVPLDKLKLFESPPLSDQYRVASAIGLSYQYLGFNMEHPILRDARVRRAIAMAVDVGELVDHYKEGYAEPADSLMTPGSPWHAAGLPTPPRDPAAASALLDEAGHPAGADGLRFKIVYKTTTNPAAVTMGRIIQGQLRRIGVELEVRSYDWGVFFEDVKTGNFDVFSLRWVGVSDPDFFHAAFHSSQTPPAGKNRVRYRNAEVDALTERGRAELDPARRKATYDRVQAILAEDLPYLSLWHNHNVAVVRRDLEGFVLHPTGGYHSLPAVRRSPPPQAGSD